LLSARLLVGELQVTRAALRRHHHIGGVIARTAGYNVASAAAAAPTGIIVA
jgi:hypothetical protein